MSNRPFLLWCFLFTILTQQLTAQWTANISVNTPVSTAIGDQAMSNSIIEDGAGGAIIVWSDYRNGIYPDIYIQRLNAAGIAQWAPNGVPICIAANTQFTPYLVPDGQGGAIISWFDNRTGNIYDIYAQHVSASGAVLWAVDGIPICTAVNHQMYSVLIPDANGGAIIAWQDDRYGADNDAVYAQRVDGAGNTLWATDGVLLCQSLEGEGFPSIASDDKGGAIIVWEDFRNGPFNREIFAQRINPAGNLLWGPNGVSICTAANHQYLPLVKADGNSGAFIVWEDIRVDPLQDIYIQHIDSMGNALWATDGVVVCNANSGQKNPRMCTDMSGGVILSWYDYRNANWDIYTQRFNAAGVAQWPANGNAVCTATNFQQYSNMLSDGMGGAYITWHDLRGNQYRDIYAQRVNAAGNMLWTNDGIAVSNATNDQMFPALVASTSDAIIVTWYDIRNGVDKDMYAQRICSTGLPDLDCKIAEATSDIQVSHAVSLFPNPTGNQLTIQSEMAYSNASLKLLDITGKIILIKNNIKGNTVTLDLTAIQSGFYYVQIMDEGQLKTFKISKE